MEKIFQSLGASFINITERGFVYGPQGKMFQRNIEKYWFLHSVTMPNYNVFLNGGQKVAEAIADLRKNRLDDVPFGLASLEDCKSSENLAHLPSECRSSLHKVGKVLIFDDPSSGKDMFLRKQRERKAWWRKLAREPSRFALSEGRRTKHSDTVHIVADFDFGKITVESVSYRRESRKIFSQLQDEVDADNVGSEVHVVEHAVSFDWGCATLLCDSFSNGPLNPSNVMHIHPKLSPYKVAFRLPRLTVDASTGDLRRLVLYLNNMLKTCGVDTILLANNEESFVSGFVPFVVETDKTSRKNGLVRVISRSTSLAETVHISNLTSYIASRCC